jgi:pyruvate-formate lyase
MRILFDGPVSRAVKKEITAQMVNKSLKKGGNTQKTQPGAFLFSAPIFQNHLIFQYINKLMASDRKLLTR